MIFFSDNENFERGPPRHAAETGIKVSTLFGLKYVSFTSYLLFLQTCIGMALVTSGKTVKSAVTSHSRDFLPREVAASPLSEYTLDVPVSSGC